MAIRIEAICGRVSPIARTERAELDGTGADGALMGFGGIIDQEIQLGSRGA